MTLSPTFQHKQDTKVQIAVETTVGSIAPDGAAFIEMPVTDYSFDNPFKHTLQQAPKRVGTGATMSDEMIKWQEHDRMFEVSLTFHATAASIDRICLNLFEDGSQPNNVLGSMPLTTKISDGASSTLPLTITIENGSHAGTDISFISCLCNSLQIAGDISNNAGILQCTATFVTGYVPVIGDKTYSGTETTITSQGTFFNIHDISTSTLDGEDVLVYAFDVTIAKEVNRVGFDSGSSFKPQGYAIGGIDVTGNLTVKRDGESVAAIDNTAGMALVLTDGTNGFEIKGDKVFVDTTSISMDDDGWKDTIPLIFSYNSAATSNAVIEIHTA